MHFFPQFAVENEELSQHLVAAKDAQRQLTAEVTSTLLRCPDLVAVHYINRRTSSPATASGAGGEILGVHRDAPRSSGGTEEPEEQELPYRDSPTLPPAGAVPNGELVPWMHYKN